MTQNRIKLLRSLAQKKSREEHGLFLAEGFRLVRDAVAAGAEIVEIFHTPAFAAEPGKKEFLHRVRAAVPVTELRSRDFDAFTETVHAQGIAALLRPAQWSVATLLRRGEGASLLVAFDRVSDPGNLGTVIRTCDWFGADGVLVGTGSVDLYNPKVVRATMGSIFHLPIAVDIDLPSVLASARESGYRVFGTDAEGGEKYDRVHYPERTILLFGNEAWGISDAAASCVDARVTIPRMGAGESLNVGVACGVILAAAKQRRE